jgi:glucokinase-like ROK family protein
LNTRFAFSPTINVKNINKYSILDLIRFTPGGVSRVDLARQMGLTRAAVTAIINDMLATGIVREAECRSTPAGRKPIVLEINPGSGKVAAIDIGATHAMVLIADYSTQVIAEKEIPFDIRRDPELCLFEIDALLRDTMQKAGLAISDLTSVGVGVPGPVIAESGSVIDPPLMPGWDGYPIREHLESLWEMPVSVNNDAELGAVGEWAYGAGRGERYLMYIKVGTGVGAGILLNGQVYQGSTGAAGEIGHITIDENGPECSCGNLGCLEALSGGRAIALQAASAVQNGQRTQLAYIDPISKITAKDVINSARNGDLVSQQIMTDAGTHLGTAIAGMVNLFNPGMIVIGGGVAQAGDLLVDPIRQMVSERSLKASSRSVRITSALLGRRSAAMGGIVQALTIALHKPQSRKEGKPVSDISISMPQREVPIPSEHGETSPL